MADKAYLAGLDLGQQLDYSSLAVAEATGKPKHYQVRHLQRWQLGTNYPTVINDVVKLFTRPPLTGATLIIDATGVGRPVLDGIRMRGIDATLVPVVITGGLQATRVRGEWHTPKADLVGAVRMLLGQGRLQIVKSLALAGVVQRELENFQVRVTASAKETYGNADAQTHDDTVISLALIGWFGERTRPTFGLRTYALRRNKNNRQRHIVVCGREQMASLDIDPGHPCLVVGINDPGTELPIPTLPGGKPLGSLALTFTDNQPSEVTGVWTDDLAAGMLSREEARRLWAWLLAPQFSPAGTPWEVLAVVDSGGEDRRALSLALGIADGLGLGRSVLHIVGEDEDTVVEEEPPNQHVYALTKASRYAVVG